MAYLSIRTDGYGGYGSRTANEDDHNGGNDENMAIFACVVGSNYDFQNGSCDEKNPRVYP